MRAGTNLLPDHQSPVKEKVLPSKAKKRGPPFLIRNCIAGVSCIGTFKMHCKISMYGFLNHWRLS